VVQTRILTTSPVWKVTYTIFYWLFDFTTLVMTLLSIIWTRKQIEVLWNLITTLRSRNHKKAYHFDGAGAIFCENQTRKNIFLRELFCAQAASHRLRLHDMLIFKILLSQDQQDLLYSELRQFLWAGAALKRHIQFGNKCNKVYMVHVYITIVMRILWWFYKIFKVCKVQKSHFPVSFSFLVPQRFA
jgi:hypothetical protein